MKRIIIPGIDSVNQDTRIEEVETLMDSFPKHSMDNQPWPEFKTNYKASFSIAHSGKSILLKYYVEEDVIKVGKYTTNEPVHKDNCVEFFIAFSRRKNTIISRSIV